MPSTAPLVKEIIVVIPPEERFAGEIVTQIKAISPGTQIAQFSDVALAASAHKDGHIFLVVTDPVEDLARRLQDSPRAESALADWKSSITPVLASARRARRRLCLLDARALASGDDETLALLALEHDSFKQNIAPVMPDPVYLVIAEALLACDRDANRSAAEIAALRRGPERRAVDPTVLQATLDQYSALAKDCALQRKAVADLGLERELMRENIGLHLESSEKLLSRINSLEGQVQQKASQQDTSSAGSGVPQGAILEELQRYKEMAADRNLHKAKAEALQRRLDEGQAKASAREAVLASVLLADQAKDADGRERKRADALQRELQSVYASRSWKVTGPLRAVRSLRKP